MTFSTVPTMRPRPVPVKRLDGLPDDQAPPLPVAPCLGLGCPSADPPADRVDRRPVRAAQAKPAPCVRLGGCFHVPSMRLPAKPVKVLDKRSGMAHSKDNGEGLEP